jgi:imidazolonepropionase-like amidohydrolase
MKKLFTIALFFALQGDPLADIKVMEKVVFVMKEGKVFKQQ